MFVLFLHSNIDCFLYGIKTPELKLLMCIALTIKVFIHFHNLCGVCSLAKTLTINVCMFRVYFVSTTIKWMAFSQCTEKSVALATKCAPLWQNMFLILEFKRMGSTRWRTQTHYAHRTWMNDWTSIPAAAAAAAARRACWFYLSTENNIQTSPWNYDFYHLAFFLSVIAVFIYSCRLRESHNSQSIP